MRLEGTRRISRSVFGTIAAAAGIAILAAAEWRAHRSVPFMMDDLWYATNLGTGETLRGFSDILESQIWHYMNWGGRCVTHGILQLTLMSGEFCADLLNLAATLFLGWMVCVIADWKSPFGFLCASSMIVAMNANVRMSMFWQAGTVNYVYSTAWILLFLWPYIRQAESPESAPPPLAGLWIPLGLMTGWSNENMGPACALVSAAVIFYLAKKRKAPVRPWMALGSAACMAGSILVIAAPGNFVRAAAIEKKPAATVLYERFCSMLYAGTDFLFPAVILLAVILLFWTICLGGRLRPAQWALAALAVLSYGAMVLSPHYPDRATFGTMAACIALSLSVLREMAARRERLRVPVGWLAFSYWFYALFALWTM